MVVEKHVYMIGDASYSDKAAIMFLYFGPNKPIDVFSQIIRKGWLAALSAENNVI